MGRCDNADLQMQTHSSDLRKITMSQIRISLASQGATDIICVNMSYKLSATGQAAVGAAGAAAGGEVEEAAKPRTRRRDCAFRPL